MFNTILKTIEFYWLHLILFLLVTISVLSLLPLAELPAVPGTDKTHHFIAYMVLAFPVALKKPKFWYLIILLFIMLGGAIELIQPYVNRYGEWLDMLANTSGIFIGVVMGVLCRFFLKKHEQL